MIIVSDTSPITNLAAIGLLDLIPQIFGKVYIPGAVYEEIVVKGAGQPGAEEIKVASWIEVRACSNQNLLRQLLLELDPGESEAIALAVEMRTENLLIDEKNGRLVALRHHLKPIGILGLLLEAKRMGLVGSVQTCIDDLRRLSGFFVAEPLYRQVLELAGEELA